MLGLLAGVIAFLTVAGWFVSLYTQYLWFDSVGYTRVFSTEIWTRVWMFVAIGGVMAIWAGANLFVAYRFRPDSVPHTPEQQSMERYRSLLEPRIGWWIAGVALIVGGFAGVSAQNRWQQYLLFANSREFGRTDPIFDVDAGFYVFELPFWQYLTGVGFTLVVVGIIAALGAHYLYGAVRMSGRGERITTAARVHLSILIGLFVLLKAVAYYLDRFALTLQENDVTNLTGGGYTEITALLPAKEILIVVAVMAAVAVVVFSNFYARSLLVPGMALGLVLLSAIAIGGIYPFAIKQIEVKPNVPQAEGDYVQHTIEGTLYGYALEGTVNDDEHKYNITVNGNADPNVVADDENTRPYLRLLDPSIVSDTFTQMQQAKGFHDFNGKLDIDRYTDADGNVRDYVVGVRELNPSKFNEDQQDWTVRHTRYTHGYGFVAAPTTRVVCDGRPYFVSGSLTNLSDEGDEAVDNECRAAKDFIDIERPEIYFGELNNDYAIVGIPDGSEPREYDRPAQGTTSEDGAEGDEKVQGEDTYVTYDGTGGVDVSSLWRRAVYAWEFGAMQFLLSDVFNENSKLLYDRNPRQRVEKVAPFLTVDSDPYPVVVDGRIKWVLDAYTSSASFPYSEVTDFGDSTSDSYSGQGTVNQSNKPVNYLRNSVKATVDAYDGTVELYEYDETDPILKVWNSAFGGIVQPRDETPEELVEHFRYPVDQFKLQRDVLQRFHVTDARTFIDATDVWEAPDDPTSSDGVAQPPYYVLAQLPEQDNPEFQLTTTFSPRQRSNALAGVLSGYYDADGNPVLNLYEIGASGSNLIESPAQVHQTLTGSQDVAEDLKLWNQEGSKVRFGNLLTLPLGNGILNVEPVYLERESASGGTGLPRLQKVMVSYGNLYAYENTLEDAIASLVAQYTGTPTPEDPEDPEEPGDEPEEPADEVSPEVKAALEKIDKAIADLRQAQSDGDFEAQGKALADLDAAMKEYDEAMGR